MIYIYIYSCVAHKFIWFSYIYRPVPFRMKYFEEKYIWNRRIYIYERVSGKTFGSERIRWFLSFLPSPWNPIAVQARDFKGEREEIDLFDSQVYYSFLWCIDSCDIYRRCTDSLWYGFWVPNTTSAFRILCTRLMVCINCVPVRLILSFLPRMPCVTQSYNMYSGVVKLYHRDG
jgi:hypothetical protein